METLRIILNKTQNTILLLIAGFIFTTVSISYATTSPPWATDVWHDTNEWAQNGKTISAQEIAENFEYLKAKIDILKDIIFPKVYVYDTPGLYTWNKLTNMTGINTVLIECWGAGGGGGAGNNKNDDWASSGGGGGGYSKDTLSFSSLPSSVAVIIGAGGAGGPSRAWGGTAGEDSSFGSYVSAGSGGGGTKNAGGVGGVGSTQNGEQGIIREGGTQGNGGAGGDSPIGGAGGVGGIYANSPGQVGIDPGGGGGGGSSNGIKGSLYGGDGAPGKCRIELFE